MSRLLEKYQINIWLYGYSPVQGTRSRFLLKVRDRFVPWFSIFFGPCPLDWRIIIHLNVDLVFFQQSWHIWLCWKIARTTFQRMVVLQSRGHNFILVEILWSQDLRVELNPWCEKKKSYYVYSSFTFRSTLRWKIKVKLQRPAGSCMRWETGLLSGDKTRRGRPRW